MLASVHRHLPDFARVGIRLRVLGAELLRPIIRPRRYARGLLLLAFFVSAPQAWDGGQRMLETAQRRGTRAVIGARALQALMESLRDADDAQRLGPINDFFNRRIRFAQDHEVWGQVDYWASPLESLQQGRGDCEDYVIAKYFSLLALGVPVASMRLVYVRALVGGRLEPHMVLAYYAEPGADPLILDNLIPELRPASRRPDLEPIFSFNSEGLWQDVGAVRAGDPLARLSRWRDVLDKVRSEGFEP